MINLLSILQLRTNIFYEIVVSLLYFHEQIVSIVQDYFQVYASLR